MVDLLKQFFAGLREDQTSALLRALWRWSVGLGLLAFALILYAPALGTSRFIYGTDTVGHDYIMHFYAWVRSISGSGDLPLWNPYIFSGLPMIGSAAICPFYPTQWLYAILPFNTAFTLQYVFALAIGGMGASWWMRCLGHRRAVCIWAGLLYMISGHFLTLTYAGHLQKMIALGWTPVALGATIQVVKLGKTGVKHSRRYKAASLLGIALGMQLLATHPQVFYATAAACVFQLIGLALLAFPWKSVLSGEQVNRKDSPSRALQKIGRAFALSLLALVVCGALAAVQLFPSMEMSSFSNRAEGVSFREATETSYPPLELLEYALPSVFGDSVKGSEVPYFGAWGERIVSDYIGTPVLLLAVFGLLGSRRRYRWFLLFLLLGGMLIGVGRHTPFYWVLWEVLPGFDGFRSPGTFMFLSNCAFVGLAALGLEYLLSLADNVNSRGWGSALDGAVSPGGEQISATGAALVNAADGQFAADETQPFSVTSLRFQNAATPPAGIDVYEVEETPPQGLVTNDFVYEDVQDGGEYGFDYSVEANARPSSNFTWQSDNRPWLGRPGVLLFIAAVAVASLVAAIIALADNWDVDLKIATQAERLAHHRHSLVAGAAVAVMCLLGGILLLRLRTWVGGLVIGITALAFPLVHNLHYLHFDPLPPFMAHLVRQPDLQALAKREPRPVRLLEQNGLKNEDMLYGISSISGYHPISPRYYTEMAQALGFESEGFNSLFAVNLARAGAENSPAGGQWTPAPDYPAGNGNQVIWRRTNRVPYLRESATVAVIDTTDISLTSASANAIMDAARFGRAGQYLARISLADATQYRLVEGPQDVTAQLKKWLPNEIRLSVRSRPSRPGARTVLPISAPWFPGWHAETSRAVPLPLIAVNGVQRGIALPAGERNIRLIYTPFSFRLGLFVSLFTLTLLVFYAIGTLTRRFAKGQKKWRKALKKAQTGQHSTVELRQGKGASI